MFAGKNFPKPTIVLGVWLLLWSVVILNYRITLRDLLSGDDFSHAKKAFTGELKRLFDFWEIEPEDVKGNWQLYSRATWGFTPGTKRLRTYWRPWQNVFLRLCATLFGKHFMLWRIAQMALAAAAGALLFAVLVALGVRSWLAFVFGAAYAIHPARNLSVVWLSASGDTIAALFVAAAFVAFERSYRQERRCSKRTLLAVSLLFYFLALGGKESAIPFALLPALYVFVLDDTPKLRTRVNRALIGLAPFAALLGAYVLFRFCSPLPPGTATFDTSHFPMLGLATIDRVIFNFIVYVLSAVLFLPEFNVLKVSEVLSLWPWAFGVLGATAITLGVLLKHSRQAVFGILAFSVMLIPVIFMPERGYFLTVPLLFLMFALAHIAEQILRAVAHPQIFRRLVELGIALWFVSALTVAQAYVWWNMQIPFATDEIFERFYNKYKNVLGKGDLVYIINQWNWIDAINGFKYKFLPNAPEFFELTFNPAVFPTSIFGKDFPGAEPDPTVGIDVEDERTLVISVNKGHFMDVPQATMWISPLYRNPANQKAWKGYGFTVFPVERDSSGYPTKLRFVFRRHTLCEPNVYFMLQRGKDIKPLDFCSILRNRSNRAQPDKP